MRVQLVPVLEALGAALIVLGLVLVAVWAALVAAGVFLLLAASAVESRRPANARVTVR